MLSDTVSRDAAPEINDGGVVPKVMTLVSGIYAGSIVFGH